MEKIEQKTYQSSIKIGLALFWNNNNYGSSLQAYAIQNILSKKGLNYEIVHYKKDYSLKTLAPYIPQLFISYVVIRKMKWTFRKIIARFMPGSLGSSLDLRKAAFAKFHNKYFKISKLIKGRQALLQQGFKYDLVIVGNDQVWAPICFGQHFFTLEWVPDSVKKVAYGSSFGVSEIPKIQLKSTQKYLKRIDIISVRENAGAQIVKKLTNRDVPVVLDATLLLTPENWNDIVPEERIVKENYIFCYFLADNPIHRNFAFQLKRKKNMKLICLSHLNGYTKVDVGFGDEVLFDIDPAQFINLIKNANYICTDSYHATIFSILFARPFFNFKRYRSEKGSINSRLETLLGALDLMDYQVEDSILLEDTLNLKKIDYDLVFIKLEKLRAKSYEFIDTFLQESISKKNHLDLDV